MTANTKYTPGPWHYGKPSREIYAHGINICRVSPGMLCGFHAPNEQTQHANAVLIAAAPDLVDCLRGLVASAIGNSEHTKSARALLARVADTPTGGNVSDFTLRKTGSIFLRQPLSPAANNIVEDL